MSGTCDDRVDTGTDDADEEGDDQVYSGVNVTAVMSDPNPAFLSTALHRFHNGPFPPQGSIITAAYLEMYLFFLPWDDANLDIFAEANASPATVVEVNLNITSRPRTIESVPWVADGIAAGGIGWYQTPSIVSVVQELADVYDIEAIAFILKPRIDIVRDLTVYSWNYPVPAVGTYGARLHLEWIDGPPSYVPSYLRRYAPLWRLMYKRDWPSAALPSG